MTPRPIDAMTREHRSAAADDRINRLVLEAHPDTQAIYRYGTSGQSPSARGGQTTPMADVLSDLRSRE